MSILDELYHEWYEMKSSTRGDISEAQKEFGILWEQVERKLDEELSEALRGSIFNYMDDECRQEFQAGFRIGAQLMQELHIPAEPQ